MEPESSEVVSEENQENVEINSKLVEDLADEYSQYLKIDSEDEYLKFFVTVEEMLAKLEEFGSLVDVIRTDTSICQSEAIPLIQKKCKEMEVVFFKIDRLEAFVQLVKDNVSVMETELVKAEDQMGSFSGLKKMLSSFVSPKKAQSKVTKQTEYIIPKIFKTEDYLSMENSKEMTKENQNTDNSKT